MLLFQIRILTMSKLIARLVGLSGLGVMVVTGYRYFWDMEYDWIPVLIAFGMAYLILFKNAQDRSSELWGKAFKAVIVSLVLCGMAVHFDVWVILILAAIVLMVIWDPRN